QASAKVRRMIIGTKVGVTRARPDRTGRWARPRSGRSLLFHLISPRAHRGHKLHSLFEQPFGLLG
ncbi:MAG: hypothetical protein WA854_06230, partial [Candidatus Binataceae bacterium]